MKAVKGEPSACHTARTVLMEHWPVPGHPPLPARKFFKISLDSGNNRSGARSREE